MALEYRVRPDGMENYEKIAVVGRGAYGVCWLCRRKELPHREKVFRHVNLTRLQNR